GKTDLAVWRASEGNWYIIESGSARLQTVTLGTQDDVPALADYDGDGKADLAVWQASTGVWTIKRSRDNVELSQVHGQSGDVPIMSKRN
ncbi:MAG TPA: FG-GAP-like repeat-containing protein, partial [Blastocatellia bacterium]